MTTATRIASSNLSADDVDDRRKATEARKAAVDKRDAATAAAAEAMHGSDRRRAPVSAPSVLQPPGTNSLEDLTRVGEMLRKAGVSAAFVNVNGTPAALTPAPAATALQSAKERIARDAQRKAEHEAQERDAARQAETFRGQGYPGALLSRIIHDGPVTMAAVIAWGITADDFTSVPDRSLWTLLHSKYTAVETKGAVLPARVLQGWFPNMLPLGNPMLGYPIEAFCFDVRRKRMVVEANAALVRFSENINIPVAEVVPELQAMKDTLDSLLSLSAGGVTQLYSGADFAVEDPALSYLAKGTALVDGGGPPHLMAGYGGTGKTMAAQSMAVSLVAGLPIWGQFAPPCRPLRVVHIDLDGQGWRVTKRRYRRLARAMGVDLAALGDVLAVAKPEQTRGLALKPELASRWLVLMKGRDLLILDCLHKASAGVDENSAEMRDGLDLLNEWSVETGCRVIVLHHARKLPPGAKPMAGQTKFSIRGSAAIFDALDCALTFNGGGQGEPVVVVHEKYREHGEPVADFALVIENVAGADGHGGTDATWGLRVRIEGVEAIDEHREQMAETKRAAGVVRDAERVIRALQKKNDQSGAALKKSAGVHTSGRLTAACDLLGEPAGFQGWRVERRPGTVGNAGATLHHLMRAPVEATAAEDVDAIRDQLRSPLRVVSGGR